MALIANIIGILGVVVLLAAYFLLQIGKIKGGDYAYSVANLFGSLMILYSVFYAWNIAAFIIETAWALISMYGIWARYRIGCQRRP
ncbi:MAG: hypothetical protein K0Q74_596 [Gammaproteobacteria bacterium]|jgi:hypothetical protein|nr:hypothetical protein [Gammaproteobacteria bacterium]